MAATALRMIQSSGEQIELVRYTDMYSPQDAKVTRWPQRSVCYGYVGTYAASMIDGTRILQGDAPIYMAVRGIEQPTPKDEIRIGQVAYNVVAVQKHNVSGKPVLYVIQGRGVQ